jgi:hypothetical protein
MFGILLFQAIVLFSMKHHFHRTCWVCLYSIYPRKPLALDCENSKDVPDDSEEQYYKEPDLFGGVEGVDYGIVYDANEEEADIEV